MGSTTFMTQFFLCTTFFGTLFFKTCFTNFEISTNTSTTKAQPKQQVLVEIITSTRQLQDSESSEIKGAELREKMVITEGVNVN